MISGFHFFNGLEGALNGVCNFFDPAMVNVYGMALRDLCEWLSKRTDKLKNSTGTQCST
jgi:predicted NBD/HSP70 family sugar kinase